MRKLFMIEDESGGSYYTGDSPFCLADQKNAIRFAKYHILLGNLRALFNQK